jgi:hypothetical protein
LAFLRIARITVNVFPPRHPFLHISASLIDPVQHSSTSLDQKAAQRDVHMAWMERVRLLENLRRLVSGLLQASSFNTEFGGQSSSVSTSPAAELNPVEGVGTATTGASSKQPKEDIFRHPSEAIFFFILHGV